MIRVEIAYALQQQQFLSLVTLKEGSTIKDAILQSKVLSLYPEIDLKKFQVGIFGKIMPLDWIVADSDRVEIYRKLVVDPKLARQEKVKAARMKKLHSKKK